MHTKSVWLLISVFAACMMPVPATAAPLYPDLFSWASQSRNYMYGGTFDLDDEPGRVLYRFNVAIPNIGDGAFQVYEETDTENNTQDVYQDIFDSEGGFNRVYMDTFAVPETQPFGHLSLEGLAQYNLREVIGGSGVGPVVATQLKTSHGLVDSTSYDLGLSGAPSTAVYYHPNLNPLGVSVGWADLYSKLIPTQRIDVTGLPSGQYWLEVVIDPFNLVQETDDSNNTTQILVDLTIPDPVFLESDFDEDTDVDLADLMLWQRGYGVLYDDNDLQNWQDDFGWTLPFSSGVASAQIPEPASLALLAVGALAILYRLSRSTRP